MRKRFQGGRYSTDFGWVFRLTVGKKLHGPHLIVNVLGWGTKKKLMVYSKFDRFFPKQFKLEPNNFLQIFAKMVMFHLSSRKNFKHFVHDSNFVASKCLPRLSDSHLCLLPTSISMGLSDFSYHPRRGAIEKKKRLQWRLTRKVWKILEILP